MHFGEGERKEILEMKGRRATRFGKPLLGIMALFAGLILVGCGLKGPPAPPEELVPKGIKDLSAIFRKNSVILRWAVPARRGDGSKLEDLGGFEVFRKEVGPEEPASLGGKEEKGINDEEGGGEGELPSNLDEETSRRWQRMDRVTVPPYTRIARARIEEPHPIQLEERVATLVDGGMDLSPAGLAYGKRYRYYVVSFNHEGLYSKISNAAEVSISPPSKPPSDLVARSGDQKASLYWQPPAENIDGTGLTDLKGYNLYRSSDPGHYPSTPVNQGLISENLYHDTGLTNHQKYYYIVKAVKGDPLLGEESEGSSEVEAIPTNRIPPSRPRGLNGMQGGGFINLTWEVNPEKDLLGYYVYRSTSPKRGYRRLTPQPISYTTYTDRDIKARVTYYYMLTAVDNASPPHESEFSLEVSLEVR
ncbi:MAG: hypothetical protein HYS70_06125 [Nitrospinae bacterium]|nr:hypothetical protein [Nitrospinota bacterium]